MEPATNAPQTTTVMERARKQKDALVKQAKRRYTAIVKDPDFKTLTLTTAGGAITLGAVGGTFGTAVGVVTGSAAGLLPALFTFGLSIPAGAVVGGAGGLAVGSSSGALVGGAAGFGGYKYRLQIKDGVIYVKKRTLTAAEETKSNTIAIVNSAAAKLRKYEADGRAQVTLLVNKTKDLATSKTERLRAFSSKKCEQAVTLAKDRKVQVTTASAATGGVAGGVTGGTVGLVAGAAVGVVPALFTFGLSIPICATIGLTTGAVGGGAVGAAGCGTAGYVGYTKRKEIGDGLQTAMQKTTTSVDFVKAKAAASAGQVRESVRALVSGGTGETA